MSGIHRVLIKLSQYIRLQLLIPARGRPAFGIVRGMLSHPLAEAFERVKYLVAIFSQNEQRYLSPGYSPTLKVTFTDTR